MCNGRCRETHPSVTWLDEDCEFILNTIRILFKLPARKPLLRIAGIFIGLLAASGVVAIVRSIPTSYANVPDERAPSEHREVANVPEDAAGARGTINRRNRASCSECGVVDSVRQIERSGVVDGQPALDVKAAGRDSGDAIVSNAIPGKRYEITLRFRDGSTMVLNEAGPRTWRLGTRVMVIGRSGSSSD